MKDRSSSRLEFSVGRGDVHDDQLSDVEPPSDDELKLDLGRHVISMDSKGADRTLHVVGNCWRRPAQLAKHRSIGTSLRKQGKRVLVFFGLTVQFDSHYGLLTLI
jgi:hypothetical protein